MDDPTKAPVYDDRRIGDFRPGHRAVLSPHPAEPWPKQYHGRQCHVVRVTAGKYPLSVVLPYRGKVLGPVAVSADDLAGAE